MTMRFMLLLKSDRNTEAGVMPTREVVAAMGRFSEDMAKAGVLLGAEGLHATSKGARIKLSGERRTVIEGPFTGAGDLIAGFWMIQVDSRQEAIEWAERCPSPGADGAEIEVRQLVEMSDFSPEVFPPELSEREQALREQLQKKAASGGRAG
jgi:hypothetical protein